MRRCPLSLPLDQALVGMMDEGLDSETALDFEDFDFELRLGEGYVILTHIATHTHTPGRATQ